MTNESALRIGWEMAQLKIMKLRTAVSLSLLVNALQAVAIAILLLEVK